MNKSLRIVLSIAVLAALSACGAKGPLILPETAVPIEVPTETAPETTPETAPESIPPVDDTKSDGVPADEQTEGVVETPLPPAKDD